jgi:hypothetical protein
MWSASMVLFAMAIAGHIAALSLIDVRPFAVYQHYGPWNRLLTQPNAAAVFVLAVQAAVCAWLAGRQWRTLVSAARQIAPAWCLAGGAALLTFSSAIPTESVERFIGEILLSCGVMVVAALVGPVVALWAVGLGARRVSMPSLLATGTAAALVAGLYFLYNAALTGNPFAAPHQLWAERLFGPGVEVLGFGPNVGIPLWRNADPLPGHGIADVLLNANKNFSLVNFELFGWAAGSLVLASTPFRGPASASPAKRSRSRDQRRGRRLDQGVSPRADSVAAAARRGRRQSPTTTSTIPIRWAPSKDAS